MADVDNEVITYRDAVMEIFGLPVFYTPWLTHPDPTVRRRTGFLTPLIGSDSNLGQTLRVPYFIVLDRDIFAVDADELLDTRITRTVVGGKTVFPTSKER